MNRMQLTPSGCPFIVRAIPQGHMVGGISLIWAIPTDTRPIAYFSFPGLRKVGKSSAIMYITSPCISFFSCNKL